VSVVLVLLVSISILFFPSVILLVNRLIKVEMTPYLIYTDFVAQIKSSSGLFLCSWTQSASFYGPSPSKNTLSSEHHNAERNPSIYVNKLTRRAVVSQLSAVAFFIFYFNGIPTESAAASGGP